jgi:hypothetical protein
MADDRKEPTERTPQGLEVPIPKRADFLRNLEKIAKSKQPDDGDEEAEPPAAEK